MKKILYSLLLAFVASISISSCTEESIKPQDGGEAGSGTCNHGCQ